nr:unnamed protein product [Callosobruchus chinensis]
MAQYVPLKSRLHRNIM